MASWRRLAPRTSAERGVAPASASVRVHVFHVFMCVMFVVFVLEGHEGRWDVVKNIFSREALETYLTVTVTVHSEVPP